MTQPPRRIGVFGGSFDPPHNTHVALVNAAVAQLGLDEMRVCPTGQAWHKARTLSAPADRLAMAQLAFGELPRVLVDDREIRRPGPTYTIDTLRELQGEYPVARIYLVMGADQAQALPTWREWHEIMRIAIISVAGRAQSASNTTEFEFPGMPGGRFVVLDLPPTTVSATEIRQRVLDHLGVAHLVPGAVARYIEQHHLYLAS